MGIDFTPMNDDPSIFPLEVEIFTYEVKNTATVETVLELLESRFSCWQNWGHGNKVFMNEAWQC